jgi:hypothetical protein
LLANLAKVRTGFESAARDVALPTIELAREWQKTIMDGLAVPKPSYVGRFRGEAGLETCQVKIGNAFGSAPAQVARELAVFESKLQRVLGVLDEKYFGRKLDTDGLAAAIDLAAWAHAEWVRIHPFANGNGRTARIWANLILVRYGIPPAIRLRPRPDDGYGAAGGRAMNGDWQPTADVFRRLVRAALVP